MTFCVERMTRQNEGGSSSSESSSESDSDDDTLHGSCDSMCDEEFVDAVELDEEG